MLKQITSLGLTALPPALLITADIGAVPLTTETRLAQEEAPPARLAMNRENASCHGLVPSRGTRGLDDGRGMCDDNRVDHGLVETKGTRRY